MRKQMKHYAYYMFFLHNLQTLAVHHVDSWNIVNDAKAPQIWKLTTKYVHHEESLQFWYEIYIPRQHSIILVQTKTSQRRIRVYTSPPVPALPGYKF